MLKKTFIAAAVAAITATPAFADVSLSYGGLPTDSTEMVTTTLAKVTRSGVLALSTSEQQVAATFGVDGDLKQNGVLTLKLTGGATWNATEVNNWLTATGIASGQENTQDLSDQINLKVRVATTLASGGEITSTGNTVSATDLADLTTLFQVDSTGTGTWTIAHTIDEDNTRLRFQLAQTTGTTNEMIRIGSAGTQTDVTVDTEVASKALDATDGVPTSYASLPTTLQTAIADAETAATLVNGGAGADTVAGVTADYEAAPNTAVSKIAALRAISAPSEVVTAVSEYLESLAGFAAGDPTESLIGAGTVINFELPEANQVFNLSAASSTVTLKVGAMKNASYSADPKPSGTLFQLGDLFDLTMLSSGTATALVSDGFLSYDTTGNSVANDADVVADSLDLVNKTSNQNIQLNKVTLTLAGDLSPFDVNSNGQLLMSSGTTSGWTVNAAKTQATATLAGDVLEGNVDLTANARGLGTTQATAWDNLGRIYVDTSVNTIAIPAQSLSVTAFMDGAAQETFEDFSDTIDNLFVFSRDGMKFDTILTGTTSANTIHIRDISGVLPDVGGKIYVTVWEYDAHATGENAERTVLADRQVLSVTLPSQGAVTLSPATIADQLGITVNPGRQARMVFEVETNQGEVAVKKKDSSGIDIQNGTKGVGAVVDFTL